MKNLSHYIKILYQFQVRKVNSRQSRFLLLCQLFGRDGELYVVYWEEKAILLLAMMVGLMVTICPVDYTHYWNGLSVHSLPALNHTQQLLGRNHHISDLNNYCLYFFVICFIAA